MSADSPASAAANPDVPRPPRGWRAVRELAPLILREWRHHPWRHGVALLAIALGVALAWSVHVINGSALQEFSSAVRAANGQPDAVLRGPREGFDEALLDRIAADPAVRLASPVVELESYAYPPAGPRVAVRVLGVDALRLAPVAPELMPQPQGPSDRFALIDPDRVFANAAARDRLGLRDGEPVPLQAGATRIAPRLGGPVAAGGGPLLVMDVAAAQAAFGMVGRLSRIDLRLAPGADTRELATRLPPGLRLADADESRQRVSNLSRAYRVNLTVLALVALFVGSFLVYSVIALSVAQRTPQLALLGVLGLTAGERRRFVLAESLALGAMGSVLGLLAGTGMAALALRALAGDLGGGFFPASGTAVPPLQLQPLDTVVFGALGVAAAALGAWWPARGAERLRPAQALKGLGSLEAPAGRAWPPLALCVAGTALAFLPPVGELPLAAYAAVAAWLFGGIAAVPWVVDLLLRAAPEPRGVLARLALARARFHRHTATAAVAGVVASLALSVALTVMVGSFREGVSRWLDQVLPADLYARTAQTAALAEQSWLPEEAVARIAALPGVLRLQPARSRALPLAPERPPVTLFARVIGDPAATLPLVGPPQPVQPDETPAYVSEAMVSLYGAGPGERLTLPVGERTVMVTVRGVWRDYARQYGTVALELADYQRLTGDRRLNDLAIWMRPGTDLGALQAAVRAAAGEAGPALDFAVPAQLRAISLAIFDRSFAVTGYLQAVAIAIGLVGVAASLSAQVLARRKEFGLLAHLGLTRREVLRLVAGETAAWLLAGALAGLALGAVISVILVHVVNPQSFHWTMDIVWPWARMAALAGAVLAAGVATAAFSARLAWSRPALLAVREEV